MSSCGSSGPDQCVVRGLLFALSPRPPLGSAQGDHRAAAGLEQGTLSRPGLRDAPTPRGSRGQEAAKALPGARQSRELLCQPPRDHEFRPFLSSTLTSPEMARIT